MKYYTPELEEFHVGFEYELMDLALNMVDKEFRSDVITHGGDIDNALEWIKTNEVRVKHLDREDIESLKWEFTGKGVADWYKIEGDFQIGTWTAYEAVMIHDPSCNWVKIHVLDRGDEVDIFQGTIKNKSELKKLLKQLGI
jgi:hypothetical protein